MKRVIEKNKANFKNKDEMIYWGIVIVLFILVIYFRVVNLRDYPGWYSDEGNHIDLAENWVNGDWENYGVVGAPFIQRPPFFMYVLSLGIKLFGVDILVSRDIAVIANIILCSNDILFIQKNIRKKSSSCYFAINGDLHHGL